MRLRAHEQCQRGHGQHGAGQRPGRPVPRRALDQRQHQQAQAQPGQRGTGPVHRRGRRLARLRQMARQLPGGQAQRHIDQEDHAPGQAEQVGMHDPAAQHLAGDGRQPQRHAQLAERAAARVAVVADADQRVHLREQHGRRHALQRARADQRIGVRRQPAQRRGQREAQHAQHEQPASAQAVAQPAAGDQQHAIGQLVGHDDEVDLREARVQRALHAGDGDVHHEQVEDGDEAAGQQHGQAQAAGTRGPGGAGEGRAEVVMEAPEQ